LAERLPATVRRFQDDGAAVMLFKNPPVLKGQMVDVRKSLADLQVTATEHASYSKSSNDLLDGLRNVTIFDPSAELCSRICATERDGRPLYFDDNHLNTFGTSAFEQAISELIQAKLR
jgi:hypothetical protein